MANKHGGKRAGAGKKPLGDAPMSRVTARLSKDDIAYLKTINPDNQSDAIRKLIEAQKGNSNV